ncbi:MAG TPA: endopeptidase La [Candidatus Fournierella merdigallinarum]|nr:endopeptidase La [Candidatus Fournierella merdigallinarum]
MSERVKIKVEHGLLHLPAIALRGLVVFPGSVIHFEVGREKSIAAVEWAMANSSPLFLITQQEMDVEQPTAEDLYRYGVVAQVKQVMRVSDELVKVLVEGQYRARLLSADAGEKMLTVTVKEAPVRGLRQGASVDAEALVRSLKLAFEAYLQLNPRMPKDVVFTVFSSSDAAFLSEYLPANLLLKYQDKQAVLDQSTLMGRLQTTLELLNRENQVLQLEKEIQDKVNDQMEKNQRDYYLREQMRAIANELDGDDDVRYEADRYLQKIHSLPLPAEAVEKLEKEAERLGKMQGNTQEAAVIRTYLDTCLGLPWGVYTTDDLDLSRIQILLDKEHYGLKKVKERILELLAVRKLAPEAKGQIICLAGPPGVGKTSIAHSIAGCMGRNYARMSLGGVRDEAEIRGHRRTYVGALPGKIISAVSTAKSMNPLILLDEIDKLASDFRGDPAAALLEALDPEQNHAFKDHYLDIPFDLSGVLFITTANDLSTIPAPLLDRMEVIELPSYTRQEKFNIAKRHLVPKQLKKNGLAGHVNLTAGAIYGLIDGYTQEAGVRGLERAITEALRKCARQVAAGERDKVTITAANLEKLMGPRRIKPDFFNRVNAVGIANGLAWTSVGGAILPIEVQAVPGGSGKIELTGSLGDVMKESAHLAVTFARVHAGEYGIDPEQFKTIDLHIHAPEGAVPKDGPSAGVTLTTALISCLSGVAVRSDVAMTGEITLHGDVLPIGGLKEKSMAAYRQGIKTVLIPQANVSDLYEVDDEVKNAIRFVPVSHLEQVLSHALLTPRHARAGHPAAGEQESKNTAPAPVPAAGQRPIGSSLRQ